MRLKLNTGATTGWTCRTGVFNTASQDIRTKCPNIARARILHHIHYNIQKITACLNQSFIALKKPKQLTLVTSYDTWSGKQVAAVYSINPGHHTGPFCSAPAIQISRFIPLHHTTNILCCSGPPFKHAFASRSKYKTHQNTVIQKDRCTGNMEGPSHAVPINAIMHQHAINFLITAINAIKKINYSKALHKMCSQQAFLT